MKNRFVVRGCRFHAKQKTKFLISGWFWDGEKGDNEIKIYLDEEEVNYEVQIREVYAKENVGKDGVIITQHYDFWVDLPAHWKATKKLSMTNSNHVDTEVAMSIPTKRLIAVEHKLHGYVDHLGKKDDILEISGWFIKQEGIQITVSDLKGNVYPVKMSYKKRYDVMHLYPEATEDEVVGFQAMYQGEVPNKIRVHMQAKDLVLDEIVTLSTSPVMKGYHKARQIYKKSKSYYHKYGALATLSHIAQRLTHRDEISYQAWYQMQCPSKVVLERQQRKTFGKMPLISIVVPLYKTPEKFLCEMIESVRNQSYMNWELCLSDGSGVNSPISSILQDYQKHDARIKVISSDKTLRISANTNEALKLATGDYIAFADHDDLLAPDALYECVRVINEHSNLDVIYTDEDKVDMTGKEHFMPHFKPDFNLDLLRSMNYICHLFVVRRGIYQLVGELNSDCDGAQDYDFVLRCIEQAKHIYHIPKILYHWRAHKESTAENPESKTYAFEAGKLALERHYERLGISATVERIGTTGTYRTRYLMDSNPLVSVIIPNKDHIAELKVCLKSLFEVNTYTNLECVIVENNSTKEETFSYYQEIQKQYPQVKVIHWSGKGFNYPAINNFGVQQAKGNYLLFLNNDAEVLHANCLEEMLSHCMRSEVGAVGAKLYYPDDTIQHAGVIVGVRGVAGHAFLGAVKQDPGYFRRIQVVQDYSAVTAACMMVKRNVFEQVDGFDEAFAVAFNDIDLCMKIREAGYLIVYTPYAQLKHYESKSRGAEDTPEKVKRFQSEIELFMTKWKNFLEKGDPYYNPNLTLDKHDFSLAVNGSRYKE
jgi:GT2 family glycosyltransferase